MGEKWKMPTNQSAILLITYNFKMFMLFEIWPSYRPSLMIKILRLVRLKASIRIRPLGKPIESSAETVSNFIKTKHLKEGENKEQKERTHVQARKQKWSTRWASKRSGQKSHSRPHYHKKHVRKGKGRYTKETLSL